MEEVDIIIDSPISFDEAQRNAIIMKAGGITLPAMSINDLIKTKKKVARPIDKLDIQELTEIKRIRKRK